MPFPTARLFVLRRLSFFQALLGRANRRHASLPPSKLLGDLIPSEIRAKLLVLRLVCRPGQARDLLDLTAKALLFRLHPAVAHGLVLARVGLHKKIPVA